MSWIDTPRLYLIAKCSVCHSALTIEVQDVVRREDVYTYVEPCQNCLENAMDDGHDEGKEEGIEEGRKQGYYEGYEMARKDLAP